MFGGVGGAGPPSSSTPGPARDVPRRELADQLGLVEAIALALLREVGQAIQRQPGIRALARLTLDGFHRAAGCRLRGGHACRRERLHRHREAVWESQVIRLKNVARGRSFVNLLLAVNGDDPHGLSAVCSGRVRPPVCQTPACGGLSRSELLARASRVCPPFSGASPGQMTEISWKSLRRASFGSMRSCTRRRSRLGSRARLRRGRAEIPSEAPLLAPPSEVTSRSARRQSEQWT
jgi:hypothetical protein